MTIVRACERAGRGGSPTVVVDESSITDAERRAVPAAAGTSHAVFISDDGREAGLPVVSLRFFTAAGELPACGHGTVAALAVLAERSRGSQYDAILRAGGRTFRGQASGYGDTYDAVFDPGPVSRRTATAVEATAVLPALGIDGSTSYTIASVGRPRMLVQVPDPETLAKLTPDMARLRDACDRLGLLGCYVYSPPSPDGRAKARMFAPSIGVPEDIANANSTACLAAHLADQGFSALAVDMGDSLGEPATVKAVSSSGASGPRVRVGGAATICE